MRQGFNADRGPGAGTILAGFLLVALINLAWIAAVVGIVVLVVRALT